MTILFRQIRNVALNCVPVVAMVLLIPVISNDWILLTAYVGIIALSFFVKYDSKDWVFFVFWLLVMTASESLFISTGVETFQRITLFGLMPVWLPVLWAYGFVAMRRALKILEES